MKILPLTKIKSIEGVELFFEHLVQKESLNFHPDTAFIEYVDDHGNPYYSAEEIEVRDTLMDEGFSVCEETGIDVYVIGQVILLEILKGKEVSRE